MIRSCSICKNIPTTDTTGDGVRIFCPECGIGIYDTAAVNHAVEMWNRIQMSPKELVFHGANLMADENETLRGVIEKLRAEIADNNNSPEK